MGLECALSCFERLLEAPFIDRAHAPRRADVELELERFAKGAQPLQRRLSAAAQVTDEFRTASGLD